MACWGPNPWGARRLYGHVANLPSDSALARALRGPRADWSWQEELAALTFDALQQLTHYFLLTHVKEGTRVPEPDMFPRPGVPAPSPPELPTIGLAEFAASLKENDGV